MPTYTARLDKRGRVTLPAAIRRQLDSSKKNFAEFVIENDGAITVQWVGRAKKPPAPATKKMPKRR
jgi:bifunctional DNA-binding transcriptional regulator/antitoxin component of YhaV-PrlF toxin-antitoxin module